MSHLSVTVITLRPRRNGRHFPNDILKWIFLNENLKNSIQILLEFVPKIRIITIQALVLILAWCRPDAKPLSEPIAVWLSTHICVTRPQWVNTILRGFYWESYVKSFRVIAIPHCIFSRGSYQRRYSSGAASNTDSNHRMHRWKHRQLYRPFLANRFWPYRCDFEQCSSFGFLCVSMIDLMALSRRMCCHQMETFAALLAICAGDSPVNSPHKGQWRGALMFSLN